MSSLAGDGVFLQGEVDIPFMLVSVPLTVGSRGPGEGLLFRFEPTESDLLVTAELCMLGSRLGKSLLFPDHKSLSVGVSSHDIVVDWPETDRWLFDEDFLEPLAD